MCWGGACVSRKSCWRCVNNRSRRCTGEIPHYHLNHLPGNVCNYRNALGWSVPATIIKSRNDVNSKSDLSESIFFHIDVLCSESTSGPNSFSQKFSHWRDVTPVPKVLNVKSCARVPLNFHWVTEYQTVLTCWARRCRWSQIRSIWTGHRHSCRRCGWCCQCGLRALRSGR